MKICQFPILEIEESGTDKKFVLQPQAILRYFCKLGGLYPSNPIDALEVESVLATISEIQHLLEISLDETLQVLMSGSAWTANENWSVRRRIAKNKENGLPFVSCQSSLLSSLASLFMAISDFLLFFELLFPLLCSICPILKKRYPIPARARRGWWEKPWPWQIFPCTVSCVFWVVLLVEKTWNHVMVMYLWLTKAKQWATIWMACPTLFLTTIRLWLITGDEPNIFQLWFPSIPNCSALTAAFRSGPPIYSILRTTE